MQRSTLVMTALAALAVAQTIVIAKLWQVSQSEANAAKVAAGAKPSKVESLPGSSLKRITLTEKGASRAGIDTKQVSEKIVERSLVVPGEIVSAGQSVDAGGSTLVSSQGGSSNLRRLIVRVPYSGDTARLDQTKPARVRHLSRDDVTLTASPIVPSGDRYGRSRRSRELTYIVSPPAGQDGGIHSGARVRVEIPQVGSGDKHKVVPHSSIIFDSQGVGWVYTNPEPLTYVREKVDVDFVQGDLAVLKSGPASGTPVVSVGATLLWGVELGK